jgi:hypothetical protein
MISQLTHQIYSASSPLTCDFFATSFFTPSFSSYHSQAESTLTPFAIPVKVLAFL